MYCYFPSFLPQKKRDVTFLNVSVGDGSVFLLSCVEMFSVLFFAKFHL